MAQVKKFLNGSVIKAEEGNKSPESQRTYGHIWVDGIDYGNSEDVYNAFAQHARNQGLNQGEFYDQWLTALRNGQDVVFGNGNTVNMKPEDMSASRAGKRSGWTKFWDDTFDTRRNHFSDAIATARRFTFVPKKVEEPAPAGKKAFDTTEILLDYNDDPNKKGHKIWSSTHQNNLAAVKRVADVIAGLNDPDNSEYTYSDALKNAYEYAKSHPTEGFEGEWTPQAFADALFARLQDPTWEGYKDPANNTDLDWLDAFGIRLIGDNTLATGSTATSATTEPSKPVANPDLDAANAKIADLETQLAALQKPVGKPVEDAIIHKTIDGTNVTSTEPDKEGWSTYTFKVDTGSNYQYNTNNNIATGRPGDQARAERHNNYLNLIGKMIGEQPLVYGEMKYPIVQEKDTNNYYALTNNGRVKIEQDFVNRWLEGKLSAQDLKQVGKWSEYNNSRQVRRDRVAASKKRETREEFNARRKREAEERKLIYGAKREENGGKIDFDKIHAFAGGGKVIKAQKGLNPNWTPGKLTLPKSYDSVLLEQLTKQPDYISYAPMPQTVKEQRLDDTIKMYNSIFGDPTTVNYKPTSSTKKVEPNGLYGGTNIDSSSAWASTIKTGLAALDYGSMAWGRNRVHDQIEKGLKDSLYKRVTPYLHGVSTATPIEDAAVARADQYISRGQTTPLTSNALTNNLTALTLQGNGLQARDQAERERSAAALQRHQLNQQIINQQNQMWAENENDFRARLAGLRMNLAQNDASLTAQRAQSIQNLAREWRTKFDEQTNKFNQLQYNNQIASETELADNNWKALLQQYSPDALNKWNAMNASDRMKYGNDITTWLQQSDYWDTNLENLYKNNRKGLNQAIETAYKNTLFSPLLKNIYRNREGVPVKRSGGSLTIKQRNRYKNEPSEDIWINQNKATHKLVAKLNDNVIKTFLKTLK